MQADSDAMARRAVDAMNAVPIPRHEVDIDGWVASIMGPSHSLDYHNWAENPYARKEDPTDWIAHKPDSDVETFWSIALGLFLQLDCVWRRPHFVNFLVSIAPDALWIVFSSPWAWYWETQDWDFQWDAVLRHTSVLLGGYPLDAYPVCIPKTTTVTGEHTINWKIPYRCYFKTGHGRVDGFNATLTNLRVWKFEPNKVLVANSTWANVTITNCTFTRCSFRNCTFSNVQFLDCNFTDVDFCDVTIQDSMMAQTVMAGTSICKSAFASVSWSTNLIHRSILDGVHSTRSNWSLIHYRGVELSDYEDSGRTENRVTIADARVGIT